MWDGNEVWLIVAVGGTFAAFPGWYAGLFSAAYLPVLLVLLALIGRGVALEYRGKVDTVRWRSVWDTVLVAGSAVAALGVGGGGGGPGAPPRSPRTATGAVRRAPRSAGTP